MPQPCFLKGPAVAGPDIDAVVRKGEFRQDNLQAVWIAIDRGGGIHGIGGHFKTGPGAAISGHGPAVEAEIDNFLHRAGIQHGHLQIGEHGFRGRRHVGGLHGVVVAHHGQDAAAGGSANHVGVPDGVDGAVQARPLAVPHGKNAVVGAVTEHGRLLRAQTGRRGQILVYSGYEMNGTVSQKTVGSPQFLVDIVHGRTAIAGNKAGGVISSCVVTQVLQHGGTYQGLTAGQIDSALLALIFIIKRHCC